MIRPIQRENKKGALIAVPFVVLVSLTTAIIVVTFLGFYFKVSKGTVKIIKGNFYYADNLPLIFLNDMSCVDYFDVPYRNNREMLEHYDFENVKRCWIYFFGNRYNYGINGGSEFNDGAVNAQLYISDGKEIQQNFVYELGDYVSDDGTIRHKEKKINDDVYHMTKEYELSLNEKLIIKMRVDYAIKR